MRFKCAKTRSLTHCLLCGSYAPYPLCTRQHKSPSWSMKAYSSVMSYVIFRTPGRAYKRQATRHEEYRIRNRKPARQHQACAHRYTLALAGNQDAILDTPAGIANNSGSVSVYRWSKRHSIARCLTLAGRQSQSGAEHGDTALAPNPGSSALAAARRAGRCRSWHRRRSRSR